MTDIRNARIVILATDGFERAAGRAAPGRRHGRGRGLGKDRAAWPLVEAGAVRDSASFWSLRTDGVNAGGNRIEAETVTDQGMITSRSPKDLPAFVTKIVEEVGEARHAA